MHTRTIVKEVFGLDENSPMAGFRMLLMIIFSSILSAWLLSLCYYPHYIHLLAWIALVPMLMIFCRIRPDMAVVQGIVFAMSHYYFSLDWLYEISPVHIAIMSFLWSLIMAVAFYCMKVIADKYSISILIILAPLCMIAQEILRSETLSRIRFAYGAIGYSQSANLYIARIASLGGVYFIGFMIVLINMAIVLFVIRRRLRDFASLGMYIGLLILLASLVKIDLYEPGSIINTAVVQTSSSGIDDIKDDILSCLDLSEDIRFIVMPEHLVVECIDENDKLVNELKDIAGNNNVYICLGVHMEARNPGNCDYDNIALMIHPDGTVSQQAKAVPIPFFIDGNPAVSQEVFDTDDCRVGIFICYDGSFTDIPRNLVDKGANLLLVPVMNPGSWPLAQRYYQIDIARFRAIELGRCIARASNSGISGFVLPTGKLISPIKPGNSCKSSYESLGIYDDRTVFVQYGHYFMPVIRWIFYLLICLVLIIDIKHNVYDKKVRQSRHKLKI